MAKKSKKKKAKLSDWIGLIFWTGVFYLMLICIFRFGAPVKEKNYVLFPTDDEFEQIELGTN
jgi:hypothetical protein